MSTPPQVPVKAPPKAPATAPSAPPAPPPSRPNPSPQPMVHGGRPDGGMHVPSAVPGAGGFDCSGAVGSNVTPGPGPARASDNVLDAPPRTGAYPGAGILNNPSGY